MRFCLFVFISREQLQQTKQRIDVSNNRLVKYLIPPGNNFFHNINIKLIKTEK